MNKKQDYRRFTIRFLLVIVLFAAIPCWWVASQQSDYRAESHVIKQLREVCPELAVKYRNIGPDWLVRLGYSPQWLERVYGVDVTNAMYGEKKDFEIPLDFNDSDLEAMLPGLRTFSHLKKLYLPFTRITDHSIPRLRELKTLNFLNLQQTGMTSPAVKRLEQDMPDVKVSFFHGLENPWE